MDINTWSLIIGVISIALAIVSMVTSYFESKKSAQNYIETQKVLDEIKKVAIDNRKSIGYAIYDANRI